MGLLASVSYGNLIGVVIFGVLVAITLVAPQRPRSLAGFSYRVASVYNEAPAPFIYLIVVSWIAPVTGGELDSPAAWLVFGLAGLTVLGLVVIAWRARQERPVVERALDDGLGAGWRESIPPALLAGIPVSPAVVG